MKGVFELFKIPLGKSIEKGEAKISTYEFSEEKNPFYNMKVIMSGGHMMRMDAGDYVRLEIENELMMSDTRMEKDSNREFCYEAKGRVLIAGLGIGLVLHNLTQSICEGKVTEIIVVEKSQDLIDLVSPYFQNNIDKLKIIQGDIFEWSPTKGEKFNTIYFDIWPKISVDNLEEMKKLHRRFKRFLDRAHPCWMDSWMKKELQKRKRQERSCY